jgi:hypothetical protein
VIECEVIVPRDLSVDPFSSPAEQALGGQQLAMTFEPYQSNEEPPPLPKPRPKPKGTETAGDVPAQPPRTKNFNAAVDKLKLNEQEQFLYNMHLQNLAAGGVPNQGKTSTLFATTVEIDGRTYVIPTVWHSQIVTPDQAVQNARAVGIQNFPNYGSEAEAEARYQGMHDFMEKDLMPPAGMTPDGAAALGAGAY